MHMLLVTPTPKRKQRGKPPTLAYIGSDPSSPGSIAGQCDGDEHTNDNAEQRAQRRLRQADTVLYPSAPGTNDVGPHPSLAFCYDARSCCASVISKEGARVALDNPHKTEARGGFKLFYFDCTMLGNDKYGPFRWQSRVTELEYISPLLDRRSLKRPACEFQVGVGVYGGDDEGQEKEEEEEAEDEDEEEDDEEAGGEKGAKSHSHRQIAKEPARKSSPRALLYPKIYHATMKKLKGKCKGAKDLKKAKVKASSAAFKACNDAGL